MPDAPRHAYDVVAYPGSAFAQTHPDRLATLARLHGLSPAPPERCRVLELGCGAGGNLVPMAYALPESTFVGLDSAGTAIAKGRAQAEALGLANVDLRHADILEARDLGTFDYVIAHGLFSWVPPEVQERVLAIAGEVLAPDGVAYVSYNAYPGCHVRNVMRQIMRWHVRGIESPEERVAEARSLVGVLGEVAPPRPLVKAILDDALQHHRRQADAVLFHDDLAEVNEPFLFADFVERAAPHGLKFLSEADYPDMRVWNPDSPAGKFLLALGDDVVTQQQYRDFIILRRFRQTLLRRAETPARPAADPAVVRSLSAGASTRPDGGAPDLASDAPVKFRDEKDGELTTPHPLSKAVFLVLGEIWPRWAPVAELFREANARVVAAGGRAATEEDELRTARFLLDAWGADVCELRSAPCRFVTRVSERPRASALARHQALTLTTVANLRHQVVMLEDPLVRTFLRLLDGTRDRATICREMAAALREAGSPAAAAAADVESGVALNFDRVARLALLEA